jgi:hypothetical protein
MQRSSTLNTCKFTVFEDLAEPKISKFYFYNLFFCQVGLSILLTFVDGILIWEMEKDVSIFDISMYNFQVPHYFNSFEDLSKYNLDFFLRKQQPVFEDWFKISSVAIIDYEVEMILRLYRFVQPYDMVTCW